MNCDSTRNIIVACLFLFICLTISSCRPDPIPVSATEVNKDYREMLGDAIRDAILLDNDNFCVLPKNTPLYKPTYDYLQQLYDQAYFFIRHDKNAPSNNQWNESRTWEVFILKSDDKRAFCLPGGHFFITTAFLKTFHLESEFYYVASFEAAIMNSRHLLNELISLANNSSELLQIAEIGTSSSNISAEQLAFSILHDISYSSEFVKEIDILTANSICETSFLTRLGIHSILSNLNPEDFWLLSRPSYYDRQDFITDELEINNATRCGDKKWSVSLQDYQNLVIDKLP